MQHVSRLMRGMSVWVLKVMVMVLQAAGFCAWTAPWLPFVTGCPVIEEQAGWHTLGALCAYMSAQPCRSLLCFQCERAYSHDTCSWQRRQLPGNDFPAGHVCRSRAMCRVFI